MHVQLRPVLESDLDLFFEDQSDQEGARMAAFPSRNREDFFRHWREKILADPTATARSIVAGGTLAGNILCWSQDDRRLIGYWVSRTFWGKGVATAALQVLLAEERARPLHALVAAHNHGSIRVLEKCGFVKVGEEQDGEVVEVTMVLR